jgi:hypothetical protein
MKGEDIKEGEAYYYHTTGFCECRECHESAAEEGEE